MGAECARRGWPLALTVRLVTVRLSSGELEVLVTSLLAAMAYPTQEFGPVCWQRWGQETYYGRLKGRLDLEHCSGQTVEAVEQDFQATVLLSNVESVVIGPAQAQLAARMAKREHKAQVNRAVGVRTNRNAPRRKFSPSRSDHYQRRVRKIVFCTCLPYFNGCGGGVRGASEQSHMIAVALLAV
jgi:hypothetical protein